LRRDTTDSTTERRISGSRVCISAQTGRLGINVPCKRFFRALPRGRRSR
jgi:hypothetical protein